MQLWNTGILATLVSVYVGLAECEPVFQPLYINQRVQNPVLPYAAPGLNYRLAPIPNHPPPFLPQPPVQAAVVQYVPQITNPAILPSIQVQAEYPSSMTNEDTSADGTNDSDDSGGAKVGGVDGNNEDYVAPLPRLRNDGRWPIALTETDDDSAMTTEQQELSSDSAESAEPTKAPQQRTNTPFKKNHTENAITKPRLIRKPVAKPNAGKKSTNVIARPTKTLALETSAVVSTPAQTEPILSSAPAVSVATTPALAQGLPAKPTMTTPASLNTSSATSVTASNTTTEAAASNGVMRVATVPTQDVLGDIRNNPSSGAGMGYHGHKIVRGVNIGGFLVPEFWITPSLIAGIPDPKPNDYLELCKRLGPDATLQLMRRHWETWVSESEVQRLAGAGLTHLRVPIGHWEFVDSDEGYVRGGLPYFKRLIYWANKYGLRVIADMHTAPGSQNGFDNSGTMSGVNWTNDPRNVALSKRALQTMLKYIASDPVVLATIDAIDLLNEPLIDLLDFEQLWEYDTGGHTLVTQGLRKVPPVVSIVDRGFKDYSWWQPRWPRDWNSKFIDAWLDAHLYHVFDRGIDNWPLEGHLKLVSQNGRDLKSNSTFFPILVGEWSLALPQAALAGKENEARRRFAEAQLDAYELGGAGWVFWCFKTEASPEWSFLDALDRSWIPQPLTNREFPPVV
ncbi:hypothetical protein LPJ55_002894 [Coemansia sp. RSA 990]|nr:hypothetical protein LPJ79_002629 [Coemansia sp. RSA 1821]KAJ1872669.1 hypothetical protein LPJ55_002894 [Coemansia sp. RSA 990]